jgi:lactoylglutathione lyase
MLVLLYGLVMVMKAKFTYVGIRVRDLKRSIEFYTKLLGMKVAGRGKVEQTRGETVGLVSEKDGFLLELNYYEKDSPYNTEYATGEGLDHLAFKVEDLDKALKEARLAGYRTVLEMKADSGRWAYIEDPNGIWIELFQ